MRLLRLAALACTLVLALSLPAAAEPVRAVWITTLGGLDWPTIHGPNRAEAQKRELTSHLDSLVRCGINTVFLQTRIRATVIYPSALEPMDDVFTWRKATPPTYDPLAFAVDECHKRGLSLHAWVVCMPAGRPQSEPCKRLAKRKGIKLIRKGGEAFLDPTSEQTAAYLAQICSEIVAKYEVDGIHLDYIRPVVAVRKNETAVRAAITRIVERISRGIKSLRPSVKLSVATLGKRDDLPRFSSYGWNAYHSGCQDVDLWTARRLVDMVVPMMYYDGNHFYPFALDWRDLSARTEVVAGLGAYCLAPSEKNWQLEQLTRQIHYLRALGLGYAFFRSRFVTSDCKGLYTWLRDNE